MQNGNFTTRPIVLGNNTVECVTTYKLLGIIISNDLKWNEHIDYVSKKSFETPLFPEDSVQPKERHPLVLLWLFESMKENISSQLGEKKLEVCAYYIAVPDCGCASNNTFIFHT